jgi:hypothetical protein
MNYEAQNKGAFRAHLLHFSTFLAIIVQSQRKDLVENGWAGF